MKKFSLRVHPLFLLTGIVYLIAGRGFAFLASLSAALVHEVAHARMADIRGYKMRRIVLMPYGAVLKGGEDISRSDSLLIALAGPIVSLLFAIVTVALWWLIPEAYHYTLDFMQANLMLALFNMIPVFPLDGARVALSLSKKKMKTLRALRISGIVFSVILLALSIVSAFFEFNLSLGVMAVFLMCGAISGTEKEMYVHIMSNVAFVKSTVDAIEFSHIGISEDAELFRFLEVVKSNRIVTFHILDRDMKEIDVLGESEIKDIVMNNELSTRYKDVRREYR